MKKHSELTKAQQATRLHYYSQFRRDGQPALLAWFGALRHMFFVANLRESVAADKRRSKAAKKAAATRKANRMESV